MGRAVSTQLIKNMMNDVSNSMILVMQNSIRTISCISDRRHGRHGRQGRTIIGKLAHLLETQMTHTLEINMLLCLETLEVKR